MPKKGKQEEEIVAEEKLQAVVIANAFELGEAWAPLSFDGPPALFPLANVPLIDYTMELLVGAGVQEMFVFCGGGAHGAQLKTYLKTSQWCATEPLAASLPRWLSVALLSKMPPACDAPNAAPAATVHRAKLLRSKNFHTFEGEKTVGDCLRECDKMRSEGSSTIHNGDMVVVTGPLVSNHDVQASIALHKQIKKADKASIMTLACKRLGRYHRTRSASDKILWGIDRDSKELLVYDEKDEQKLLKIEPQLLKQSRSLTLATDLVDTRVYICTPQVLIEFDSNFDFHTMEQLIADLLLNAELYGHKMFVDEVSDTSYAAPLKCVHSYDAVSRDVLARWVYPQTLDTHWHNRPAGPQTQYACTRGNTYKEASARLARSAHLGANSALGRGTTVGENSVLERCVVGDDCKIGENCTLTDCYIWKGCVVEDGVVVTNAVVSEKCKLRAGCRVSEGCLIGAGAVIGSGFTVQPYTRITTVEETVASPRASDVSAVAAAAVEEEEEDSEDSVDEDTDDEDDGAAAEAAVAEAARKARVDKLASEAAAEAEADVEWFPDEVGEGGVGRVYHTGDGDDDQTEVDADGVETVMLRGPRGDGSNAIGFIPQRPRGVGELLPESEEEGEEVEENNVWNPSAAGKARFSEEMRDTLRARMAEDAHVDTLLVEMKSLRLSHNADIVVDLIPAALPEILNAATVSGESKVYTKALNTVIKRWGGVLSAFVRDSQDQLAILGTVFDWVCDEEGDGALMEVRMPQIGYILQFLYQYDIVGEEPISEWEVRFRWKNPDFLSRNPDFLFSKNG